MRTVVGNTCPPGPRKGELKSSGRSRGRALGLVDIRAGLVGIQPDLAQVSACVGVGLDEGVAEIVG
jgi:hypothetical protein